MKRILVPVDFSASSGKTLRYAASLSKHLEMGLTLVHVYAARDYSMRFDFGKEDYNTGILAMLAAFYKEYVDEPTAPTRFLAQSGSLSEQIASISNQFELIVLSFKAPGSRLARWLGSKTSAIASQAKCPVLIIPEFEYFPAYLEWKKIWHIKRYQQEEDIIAKKLSGLKIQPNSLEVKSFEQAAFKSSFWKAIVAYRQNPKKELQEAVFKAKQTEVIDLFVLVSHGKARFEKFTKDDTMQIIFRFNVPLLIFHAPN